MKKLLTAFSLVLCICLSCQQSGNKEVKNSSVASFSETSETDSIMKIIKQETECFYKRDYDGWKETRAEEDYAFQGWSNPDGTFDAMVGWPEINEKMGKYIKENQVPKGESSHPKVERRNMKVKFYGDNAAFLVWDQYNLDNESKKFYYSKDSRIMEKINGRWKIVNVSSFWDYKNLIPEDSLKM